MGVIKSIEAAKVTAIMNARGLTPTDSAVKTAIGSSRATEALLDIKAVKSIDRKKKADTRA
jgi:hypothetical protein